MAGYSITYPKCSLCAKPLGRFHVSHDASAEEQARKAAEQRQMVCASCANERNRECGK